MSQCYEFVGALHKALWGPTLSCTRLDSTKNLVTVPEMTDGFEIGGVLLEPLPLTRRPLLSVLLFSATRTNLTRAGTLQQPECRDCRDAARSTKIKTSKGSVLKRFH